MSWYAILIWSRERQIIISRCCQEMMSIFRFLYWFSVLIIWMQDPKLNKLWLNRFSNIVMIIFVSMSLDVFNCVLTKFCLISILSILFQGEYLLIVSLYNAFIDWNYNLTSILSKCLKCIKTFYVCLSRWAGANGTVGVLHSVNGKVLQLWSWFSVWTQPKQI